MLTAHQRTDRSRAPGGWTWLLLLLVAAGCAQPGGGIRRLSIATGGTGGVYYPYGGAIARVISQYLPDTEATAEVTAASVDNLKFVRDGKADIAFTLADTLADAVNGRGPFEGEAVPARTIAVLYSNYTHIVTATPEVTSVADLRGRTVSTGAPGSGSEVIALRVLQAAGLDPDRDVSRQGLGVSQSADALRDGKIHAFFWSGGLPTAAVLDLAHTPGFALRLLPSDAYLGALQARYGENLYSRLVIPANAYPGQSAAVPVIGVDNVLVVSASMPDDLAFDITRLLFEHKDELVAVHPEASNLDLERASQGSPAPLHPGAARFYQERHPGSE